MNKVSSYIITHNSEKYLKAILTQLNKVADEIIILDSGSTDTTQNIASNFEKVRFEYRVFDNFKNQRNAAADLCSNDIIFFLDSDEIPNDELIEDIIKLKKEGFAKQAYKVKRVWIALNTKIHALYPCSSPDFLVRIFNKQYCSFNSNSRLVHETLLGYTTEGIIKGEILHKTFHNKEELYSKLDKYTDLAATDMINNNKNTGLLKLLLSPIAAFIKWYFIEGNIKDGWTGIILANYARLYTFKKYMKARKLKTKSAN